MRRGLFGPAGFGLDPVGTEASVEKISVADLCAFHRNLVVPNNCVLAIYGDVKTADVKSAVEKAFGGWKTGAKIQPPTSTIQQPAPNRVTETRDKKQAVLVIGFPG